RARHGVRRPRAGGARAPHGEPDDARRGAPAVDRPPRGQHRRHRARRDRRVRAARGAARARRGVSEALRAPVPGHRHGRGRRARTAGAAAPAGAAAQGGAVGPRVASGRAGLAGRRPRVESTAFRRHWTWRTRAFVAVAGAAIALALRLVYLTLRVRLVDEPGVFAARARGQRVIGAFWHDAIPLVPLLKRFRWPGRGTIMLSWHR